MLPCAGRRGLGLLRIRLGAGLAAAAKAMQADGHMPPQLLCIAFLRVEMPHHAVRVHRHLGVTECSSRIGQTLQRQCGLALGTARDGQNDVAAVLQAALQHQIIAGVVQVFFTEHHIHADGAGLPLVDALQQGAVQSASPGPAANGVDAVVINGDDDDIGRGGSLVQPA